MKNTEMFFFFDSGYEIEYSLGTNKNKLFFFKEHDRVWARCRCLSLISSIKTCYIILIQHLITCALTEAGCLFIFILDPKDEDVFSS